MGIIELHEREKKPRLVWNAPKYYDHPDGEDLMGKLSFVCKNTAALATFFGIAYANKPPKTNSIGKLIRIAKFTLPGVAMGAAFTCATYYSTVLRGEDDEWNHCIGGVAAGLLLGPAMGVPSYSSFGVWLLGSLAYVNKHYNMLGYGIVSNSHRAPSSYYKRKLDTTLLPELKGNWTKDA